MFAPAKAQGWNKVQEATTHTLDVPSPLGATEVGRGVWCVVNLLVASCMCEACVGAWWGRVGQDLGWAHVEQCSWWESLSAQRRNA